jgi:hypothetical protein
MIMPLSGGYLAKLLNRAIALNPYDKLLTAFQSTTKKLKKGSKKQPNQLPDHLLPRTMPSSEIKRSTRSPSQVLLTVRDPLTNPLSDTSFESTDGELRESHSVDKDRYASFLISSALPNFQKTYCPVLMRSVSLLNTACRK